MAKGRMSFRRKPWLVMGGVFLTILTPQRLEIYAFGDITGVVGADAHSYTDERMLEYIHYHIADNWLDSTGRGDFNRDGITNFTDFAILINTPNTPQKPLSEPYIIRDIKGHPRDFPDAGPYEYREDTALADIVYYIVNNWLDTTGKGDFNHDGITDFIDYMILAEWWQNR